MVRSTRRHVEELRQQVEVAAGGMCEWSGCIQRGEQMAHLQGKGMGGSAEADRLENVALLCVYHHDILDGRRSAGTKEAMRSLLAEVLRARRSPFDV